MRYFEIALLSLPALLLVAWLLGLRHASYRIFMVMALILAALGALLAWFGQERGFTGHYTPTQLNSSQDTP